jgi:hypothetical protein
MHLPRDFGGQRRGRKRRIVSERPFYSVSTEDGHWRFRRRWAAERAFELAELSAEQPALVLSRLAPDGVVTVLAERHFEEPEEEGSE